MTFFRLQRLEIKIPSAQIRSAVRDDVVFLPEVWPKGFVSHPGAAAVTFVLSSSEML